jgi:hypothetical protein
VPPPAKEDSPVPEKVGGYRLLHRLGTGGMGAVYEAEEITSGRRVALKLLTPQAAASRAALERFRQEGRLASQIAHPGCVFVLAADEEAGRPYIVMELMTGATLKDLVEQRGPLPPEEAVAKILDVIDGLEEAHHLGVIHRDVKPSNCFLLPSGRVKIGDFGLSKSLFSDAHLTQSGIFLGTPLFASPEQLKGGAIDFRTDVYSVAATLYYLLTGQAPFQKGNAVATLAGIVSETPPPLRSLRPEVSAALDQVVLIGLERDPLRRWQSLEEFRAALMPFLPGHLSFGAMRMRLGALLIDCALFVPFWILTGVVLRPYTTGPDPVTGKLISFVVSTVFWLLYFTVLEGRWRASLGKRLLRLRVYTAGGSDAPGLGRAALRTLVFSVLVILPWVMGEPDFTEGLSGANLVWGVFQALGFGLLVGPMRAGNGYRGLHEFLSGTRVVTLPPLERLQLLEKRYSRFRQQVGGFFASSRLIPAQVLRFLHLDPDAPECLPRNGTRHDLSRPEGLPEAVGPFVVRGALCWEPTEQVLWGEDPGLGRDVWIRLRPAAAAPLDEGRRELARPTRLRWVTGGRCAGGQWDAFVAPPGRPLPELVEGKTPLGWREVRPILQQLADELAAAAADGTLPPGLTVDQVWVQPNGRVQLLDFPPRNPGAMREEAGSSQDGVDSSLPTAPGLALLGQVAVLALEGRRRPAGEPPAPVHASLPEHAAEILRRLLGVKQPYRDVAELQADLTATRDRPTRINFAIRAAHLGVLGFFLFPGLSLMLFTTGSYDIRLIDEVTKAFQLGQKAAERISDSNAFLYWIVNTVTIFGAVTAWPVFWVLWAFCWRGGLSFSLMGISLVRRNGQRASRLQCAWRAALVWAPVTALLGLSAWLEAHYAEEVTWLRWGIWWLAIAVLAGYALSALMFPSRALHDRLSGTYLVPK